LEFPSECGGFWLRGVGRWGVEFLVGDR
jgi:hypothetical protein